MNLQPQIDPTALALSRAIRAAEGGDYSNYSGDNGTSAGAYQWSNGTEKLTPGQVPKNFQDAAKKFGLDPTDFSPKNQNHVAYEQIKEQLDAGHSQSEVASWWNSGSYDPTGKVGYNKSIGVSYDTPSYVNAVKNHYQNQLSGGLPSASTNTTSLSQQGTGMPQFPQAAQLPQGQQPTQQTIQQPSLGQSVAQGVGGVLNAIEAPVAGLLGTGSQLVSKATGKPDIFPNGVPSIGTLLGAGNVPVSNLSLEAKAGDIAQIGSYYVPGGEGVLPTIAGAAGMGALQGAGSAMSQEKDLPTVATSGLLGAGVGAGTAGLLSSAGVLTSKFGDTISGADQTTALEGIKNAYSNALNLSAGERAFENRSGKDLAQVLVDNQAPLSKYEDGTLDASGAIPILQKKLAPLDTEAQQILSGSDAKVNLLDAAEQAKTAMTQKASTALEQKSANAEIDQYMQAEIDKRMQSIAQATYGQDFSSLTAQQKSKVLFDAANPSVGEADKIKTGFWNSTFDKNRSNISNHVPYQIGSSLKDSIESAVPDEQLAQVNSERGDLIDAVRRLQKMDGVKLLRGGRVSKLAAGGIGALAGMGSGLGPLGPLAGDYFGQKAADFLQNPTTQIAIATGKAKATSLLPRMLGNARIPVGNAISSFGGLLSKSARPVGLVANLLTK